MKLSTTVKIIFFLKLQDFAGLRRHQGRSEQLTSSSIFWKKESTSIKMFLTGGLQL